MSPRLRATSRERTSRPRSPVRAIVVPGNIRRGGTQTTFLPTRQLTMAPSLVTSTSSNVTLFEPITIATCSPGLARRIGRASSTPLLWCARGSRARAYQGVLGTVHPTCVKHNGDEHRHDVVHRG